MRWKDERRSENVEDRRGQSASPRLASGAPVLLQLVPMLLRSRGGRYLLGILAVLVIGAQFLGVDILSLLTTGGPAVQAPSGQQAAPSAAEQAVLEFAEIYAQDPGALTDELADGVKRHFGEAGLVCLIEALGFIEGRIRLALMFTALGAVTAH